MTDCFVVQLCHPLTDDQRASITRWGALGLFRDFVIDEADVLHPVLRMASAKPMTLKQLQSCMSGNFKRWGIVLPKYERGVSHTLTTQQYIEAGVSSGLKRVVESYVESVISTASASVCEAEARIKKAKLAVEAEVERRFWNISVGPCFDALSFEGAARGKDRE